MPEASMSPPVNDSDESQVTQSVHVPYLALRRHASYVPSALRGVPEQTCVGLWGLGFEVQGLGFRVQGMGYGV